MAAVVVETRAHMPGLITELHVGNRVASMVSMENEKKKLGRSFRNCFSY